MSKNIIKHTINGVLMNPTSPISGAVIGTINGVMQETPLGEIIGDELDKIPILGGMAETMLRGTPCRPEDYEVDETDDDSATDDYDYGSAIDEHPFFVNVKEF